MFTQFTHALQFCVKKKIYIYKILVLFLLGTSKGTRSTNAFSSFRM